MNSEEIAQDYPFYNLTDIVAGSLNLKDEGYFDGNTVFDWWKRSAKENGVEYLCNEVVAMTKDKIGRQVESVTLRTGELISCGKSC